MQTKSCWRHVTASKLLIAPSVLVSHLFLGIKQLSAYMVVAVNMFQCVILQLDRGDGHGTVLHCKNNQEAWKFQPHASCSTVLSE